MPKPKSKPKRKRQTLARKTSAEIAEQLFGKEAKAELDRIAHAARRWPPKTRQPVSSRTP